MTIENQQTGSSAKSVSASSGKKLRVGTILFALIILLLVAGAGLYVAKNYLHPETTILTLTGSSTLGEDLMPKMAEDYLRTARKATRTGVEVVSKTADGYANLKIWGDVPGEYHREVIAINISGSGNAFKCLAGDKETGLCDIGMSSRPFNDQDRSKYPSLENLHTPSDEHVVAFDGIAIIVNPSNRVTRLTMAQLHDIYLKKITNWKEVGGSDAPIELYGRGEYSGTAEMFSLYVLGKDNSGNLLHPQIDDAHKFPRGNQVVTTILGDPNGIGYVSSPQVGEAKALPIADTGDNYLYPSDVNIVTEDYPITRRLYLYQKSNSSDVAKDFIHYAALGQGQDVAVRTHYVALSIRTYDMKAMPIDAPQEYKNFAATYDKLGLSFRFASGKLDVGDTQSITLDNLAFDNIVRMQQYLAQHPKAQGKFLLIGFSDNSGDKYTNYLLGLARANNIKNNLESVGIHVQPDHVISLGMEMPVASNATQAGKNSNRRVEVWVPKEVH